MNTLSWLLYAAGAIGNTQGVMVGVAVACGVALGSVALAAGLVSTTIYNDADRKNRDWLVSKIKPLAIACVCLALIASVIPSRNTIMLIAASEVGGQLLSTEQAAEIGGEAGALAADSMRVLRKFINDQLDSKGAAE